MERNISAKVLKDLYLRGRKSTTEIAGLLNCSEGKVNYWFKKHEIKKRTIAEAIYLKRNPKGDPFKIKKYLTKSQSFLHGLGIGLYWGEGNKKNKHSVRLGNTDAKLIKKFIKFLVIIYSIEIERLRFGLQIFDDMNLEDTLAFWEKELGVGREHFYKVTVTKSRGVGNYREKTKYGVITVHFHNKKLRDIICQEIEKL